MATKDWNGFKKSGDTYIPNDATARANITAIKDGTNIDSFGDVETALAGKVDKVQGKGLSTNDYDNTAKGIVTTAQNNIKANTKLIKDTVGWSGKNKWVTDLFTDKTVTGVRAVVNSDKSITVTGSNTESGNNVFECGKIVLEAGNYKLSGAIGGGVNTISLQVYKDSSNMWYDIGNGVNISLSADSTLKLRVYFKAGLSNVNVTFYPMLRDASILDDTYEPYFGSTAFPRSEQAVLGARNIIKNTATSGTYSNVVATVNSDKTISLSGISNSNDMSLFIMGKGWGNNDKVALSDTELVVGESYILHKGFSLANTNLGIRFYNSSNVDIGGVLVAGEAEKQRFTIPAETASIVCFFRATSGTDVTGKVLKPMITLDTDTDDNYSEPAMTNRELTDKVQGIIDAATNAADFAAFKTALAAL